MAILCKPIFSGLILKNQDALIGNRNLAEKIAGRELFLKSNKNKSLQELLDAYSVESLIEKTEEK